MNSIQMNIIILSNQKHRSAIIESHIKSSFADKVHVDVLDPNFILSVNYFKKKYIIILDLMGIDQPAKKIIHQIKQAHEATKIIALHMYRSSILVKPLFDLGVNGYIYCEPTKEELIDAIVKVSNGDFYKPANIYCE